MRAHAPHISLSDLCDLLAVTPRAVRFYEQIGMVESDRDPRQRRMFDLRNRERLRWIARLRRAGLPLSDVGEILDAESEAGAGRRVAVAALERRARLVSAELAEVDRALAELSVASA